MLFRSLDSKESQVNRTLANRRHQYYKSERKQDGEIRVHREGGIRITWIRLTAPPASFTSEEWKRELHGGDVRGGDEWKSEQLFCLRAEARNRRI